MGLSDAEIAALAFLADGEWHAPEPPRTRSTLCWLACAGMADMDLGGSTLLFRITEDGRDAARQGLYWLDVFECLSRADAYLETGFDPAIMTACLLQICRHQAAQIRSLEELHEDQS